MANDIPLGDLTTKLKVGYDKGQAAEIEASFKRIQDQINKSNQNLGAGAQALRTLEQGAGAVTTAFQGVGQAANDFGNKLNSAISTGAAATAQLKTQIDSAGQSYRQAAGNAEQASRSWAAANLQVEQGYIAIGRVITQQTLPGMRLQAALLTDIANAAKNNPQITGAIAGASGAISLAHGASQAVGGGALGGFVGAGALGLGAVAAGANATKDQSGILGAIHSALQTGFLDVTNAVSKVAPETGNQLRGLVGAGGGGVSKSQLTSAPVPLTGAQQLAASPNQAQAVQAQIAYNRALVENEIQVGQQRVQQAIQAGRQIIAEALQQTRQREDLTRTQGRAAQDFQTQQGRQLSDMATQQGRQRRDENVNFFHQQTVETQDYQRQQIIQLRDFGRQQQREVRDEQIAEGRDAAAFQYSQAKETLQFQIEQTNASHNFYTQQTRDAEDHQFRLLDLASTRDALGIYKENRNYNVQRQRAQEDFSYQQGIANQQRQITVKDELYQYNLQRTYRLADFSRQQADQKQNLLWQQQQAADDFHYRQKQETDALQFQRDQEKVHFKDQLDDMNTAAQRFKDDQNLQYRRQNDDMQTAQQRFDEDLKTQWGYQESDMVIAQDSFRKSQNRQLGYQLQDLSDHIGLTQDQWNKFYTTQVKQLSVFIDDMQARAAGPEAQAAFENALTDAQRALIGLPPIHERAAGGYAALGTYSLGEQGREFVLNAATTHAAEASLNGQLTQEAILGSLRGEGAFGGSGGITLNQNFTFQGSFTEADRQWFRQAARDEAVSAMTTAVRNVTAARRR